MLKKNIVYVDYDGNERKEDFYFNLTATELMSMEMGVKGGLQKMLEKIIAEKDAEKIYNMFTEIILKSYGEKSPDGKRFIKSEELSEAFSQTEAYNLLCMELVSDADAASTFINGIVPQKQLEELQRKQAALNK